MWTEDAQAFLAHDIVVLTLEGGSIGEITAFLDADVFTGFGLPGSLS
jgi:hypothetical protein